MSFLKQVAQQISERHPEGLQNVCVVWPNRRAGYLFKESFKELENFNGFLPETWTIEQLAEKISDITLIQPIELRCLFYQVYQTINHDLEKENFISFLSWAEILLSDFDQIDLQMAPPDKVLNYLSQLKEIDHWSRNIANKKGLKEKYLHQWKYYLPLYQSLYSTLQSNKTGYRGLVYRKAAENANTFWKQTNQSWYFAGFSALSKAEENIITSAVLQNKALNFWDFDTFFVENELYEAGYLIKKIIEHPVLNAQKNIPTQNQFVQPKHIEARAVSGHIAQAKNLGVLLQSLINEKHDLRKTTVILSDENLLIPVLNSLPESLSEVNITMGYPLSGRPSVQCIKKLIEVWYQVHQQKPLHYSVLIDLCERVKNFTHEKSIEAIKNSIHLQNKIYYTKKETRLLIPKDTTALIGVLFSPHHYKNVFEYVNAFILACKSGLTDNLSEINLLKEALFKMHNSIHQLEKLVNKYPFLSEGNILIGFFDEMLAQQTLSFRGEPNKGLQIMGMLESRNLDFDHVIFLSANEGFLPPENTRNSLLPFEVRSAFGLPSFEETDAIYAYHFFRLIAKAKKIHFFYNANVSKLGANEPSRYLKQLELNSPHTVEYKQVMPKIEPLHPSPGQLIKDANWLDILTKRADKGLSASLLSSYIYNPWDFYQKFILGISEETETEETLSERSIGNVVHKVLEGLYLPYKGKLLNETDFTGMLKKYPALMDAALAKYYPGGSMDIGKNILIKEVIKRHIERMLKMDKKEVSMGSQLLLIDVEKEFRIPLNIPNLPTTVYLKGVIDRIDKITTEKGETLRIIDYKTGSVEPNDLKISDLSLLLEDAKYNKLFQLLVYAWAIWEEKGTASRPGIISFKKFGNGFISCDFGNKQHTLSEELLSEFKNVLTQLIKEIFDPEIPLTEKIK